MVRRLRRPRPGTAPSGLASRSSWNYSARAPTDAEAIQRPLS
jgi:hypothetical protein